MRYRHHHPEGQKQEADECGGGGEGAMRGPSNGETLSILLDGGKQPEWRGRALPGTGTHVPHGRQPKPLQVLNRAGHKCEQ